MKSETQVSPKFSDLIRAIRSMEPVAGFTHTFYRYPARFSPLFASAAIRHFSEPGDIVLDPFMGGGTTLVEARALGRRSIGSDVSSLAVFLSKSKTMLLTDCDRASISSWANTVVFDCLNLRNRAPRNKEWIEEGYQRNASGRFTWAIRKTVELALAQLNSLQTEQQRMFARCVILRTAQWALDCRKVTPSATEFRVQFMVFLREMIHGHGQFTRACNDWPFQAEPICLHQSAVTLDETYRHIGLESPRLVLTSPPYPGVHVVYHRWQVFGRRETPAAFWISGTKDGAGSSYYTFGDRHQDGLTDYFQTAFDAFSAIAKIADERTTVVQMVAFSEHGWQLDRYLEVMREAGFAEVSADGSSQVPTRVWRTVPNRKWYAMKQGRTSSSSEVVLFHQLAR